MKKHPYNLKTLLLFVILSAVFCSQAVYAQTEAYLKKEFHTSSGDLLPYRILYPENMDHGKTYPVVLFLHGAGERGNDNEKQLVHGSEMFLRENIRRDYPAIVVFPQCPEEIWWAPGEVLTGVRTKTFEFPEESYPPSKPMQWVIELMEEIIAKPYTNTQQLYLMGLSMGGFGTFDLLHRRPDWFAAAAPICGGGDHNKAPLYARNTSFWIFHGSDDMVVPVEGSVMMKRAIKEAGGEVKYTEYPDVGHNSWDPAFEEENLIPWLFSNRKSD